MIPSNTLPLFIKQFEGFVAHPYLDSKGTATIGIGTTIYPNGTKVTLEDTSITLAKAQEYLLFALDQVSKQLDELLLGCRIPLTQNQYDALCSLLYNIGYNNFADSKLLAEVRQNPNNSDIKNQFMNWVYSNGVKLYGLEKRRATEYKLYCS